MSGQASCELHFGNTSDVCLFMELCSVLRGSGVIKHAFESNPSRCSTPNEQQDGFSFS